MNSNLLGHILFYVILIASGISQNPGKPLSEILGSALVYGVIASIIFSNQSKKRSGIEAWLIAMFFPLYAIYYLILGRKKGVHNSAAEGRPKVGAFMRGYTGTDKKVICKNCGCRLGKGIFGGWTPIAADSHCARVGKKCVPEESFL